MIKQHLTAGMEAAAAFFVRLAGDRRGAAAVTFALAMPILLGMMGLGVEAGVWYQGRHNLQTAADAAALGGALQRAAGNTANIAAAAAHDAAQNGFTPGGMSSMKVYFPPVDGAYAGSLKAVEVVMTRQKPRLFSVLFLKQNPTLAVRAVAEIKVTGSACVLALDPTVSGGVTVQGSTVVSMANCYVAANSDDVSAISLGGSGNMTADSLWTPGNYYLGGSASLTVQSDPKTHAWPLADPFAGTTISLPPGCTANNVQLHGTVTIDPGVYCHGMTFGAQSVVTLNPGTYYVDSGDITVNGQATITCNCTSATDGVTFVLTSSTGASNIGTVTINGGANVTLQAPSGPGATYPGLLFFQDRNAPLDNVDKLNGGSTMHLSGGVYLPQGAVQWSGNSAQGTAACVQLVANTVTFIGNSTIDNTGCAALGLKPVTIAGAHLVE